jgi:hypothetical protein
VENNGAVSKTLVEQTATLHFGGLVLFTTLDVPQKAAGRPPQAIVDRPEVFAIMPRVENHDPDAIHLHRLALSNQIAAHTAVIAFKLDDVVPRSILGGWTYEQLRPNLYAIELHGERLTFVTDGSNDAARYDALKLPRVNGARQLDTAYLSTTGAAAIFRIPIGALSPCASGTRVDTLLKLKNHGTITIKTDSNKSITFKGNAVVELANMPMSWLRTQTPDAAAEVHYEIYCQMTGVQGDDCRPPVPQSATACEDQTLVMLPPPGVVATGTSGPTYLNNVFCSNSQWP